MKYENFNRTGASRRILLAPLDWGLGHASRCIPLIYHLQSRGYEVVIAASGKTAALLQEEFPAIRIIFLRGYNMRYSKRPNWLPLTLLWQFPKLLLAVFSENHWLKKLLKKESFDGIISDNRLGFYSRSVPSYYITHQLLIKTGNRFTEKIAQWIHYSFINKFTACWVPDAAGAINLAGDLSHPVKLPGVPLCYLGPFSRLQNNGVTNKNFLLVILSGPEPQRSIFENMLLLQLKNSETETILIRGLPGDSETITVEEEKLKIYNHVPSQNLAELIGSASAIICRSGYSSVMDLVVLNQKALLVPTPGQTEQEYLATYLMEKNIFPFVKQNEFDLKKALEYIASFRFQFPDFKEDTFKEVLNRFFPGDD